MLYIRRTSYTCSACITRYAAAIGSKLYSDQNANSMPCVHNSQCISPFTLTYTLTYSFIHSLTQSSDIRDGHIHKIYWKLSFANTGEQAVGRACSPLYLSRTAFTLNLMRTGLNNNAEMQLANVIRYAWLATARKLCRPFECVASIHAILGSVYVCFVYLQYHHVVLIVESGYR